MTTSILQTKSRRAFTLVELLVAISIISILLGLLISTVRAVRRFSRQTITRGELKNIEAAWKQFYSHYQYWPGSTAIEGHWPQTDDTDTRYELLAPLARMLEGADIENVDDPTGLITTYNADRIAFLELTRFNRTGDPVNAWGRAREIEVAGKERPNTYVVIFDTNGDNQIMVELPGEPATNLFRSVAVWTENPEYVADEADRSGPPRYFGSWTE